MVMPTNLFHLVNKGRYSGYQMGFMRLTEVGIAQFPNDVTKTHEY